MECVVCGATITMACYAGAWERSRKLYPCCSDACAARFDPDQHWIPAAMPAPADDAEARRLLAVYRFAKSGDQRDPAAIDAALADLDRWDAARTRAQGKMPSSL